MFAFSMIIIAFELAILTFASRLELFGVGMLLGIGIVRILPGAQENLLWLIISIGLAVIFLNWV